MITISRLYDTYDTAADAVAELERAGIPERDISIIANNSDNWYDRDGEPRRDDRSGNAGTGAGIGAALGGVAGLLAGLGMLAIPGLGPVVAAGWLVSAGAVALAGGVAGGVIGALTTAGVSEEEAHVYAEGVRRGGTLVSARVPDGEQARYEAILDRSAVDIRERAALYQRGGWNRFDPDAPPYTPDEVQRERDTYRRP